MDQKRIPKPGEIYNHFKDKPYQIITVALHTETRELMVVYQALYGDYRTYCRPLDMFLSEVDRAKYPEAKQKYRFELVRTQEWETAVIDSIIDQKEEKQNKLLQKQLVKESENDNQKIETRKETQIENNTVHLQPQQLEEVEQNTGEVSSLLLEFLDAASYSKKLEILTSNVKHINDRMINDMAVALDCTVDEGPLEQRIQGLINCLQAMRRFEDRRLR